MVCDRKQILFFSYNLLIFSEAQLLKSTVSYSITAIILLSLIAFEISSLSQMMFILL